LPNPNRAPAISRPAMGRVSSTDRATSTCIIHRLSPRLGVRTRTTRAG
jgi:hypothetical protein